MNMTMHKRVFLLGLMAFVFLARIPAMAQTAAVSDLSIDYKVDLNDPEMDPMAKMMLSGAKMTISFLGQKSRVDMNMNAMMRTVAISDEATKKSIVLLDMLGKKTAMVPEDDPTKLKENYDATSTKTGKTKTIAGYKCEEYIVKSSDGDQLHMWCTSAIKPKSSATDFSFKNVNGFPLEMDMSQDGMKMRMTATKVNLAKPDAKLFSTAVPAGYEVKTQEELMNDFGGGKK
jgi:hypothetical protein